MSGHASADIVWERDSADLVTASAAHCLKARRSDRRLRQAIAEWHGSRRMDSIGKKLTR